MIGYGRRPKAGATTTVTLANQLISVGRSTPYNSTDFLTSDGAVSNGMTSTTNNSQLVSGDSGGGDFIYNSSLGEWQLAGINEAIGPAPLGRYNGQWYLGATMPPTFRPGSTNVQDNVDFSAMVQIDAYGSQIDAIVDAPEPPVWAMLSLRVGDGHGRPAWRVPPAPASCARADRSLTSPTDRRSSPASACSAGAFLRALLFP